MKTFKHWTRGEMARTFGLDVRQQCNDLDNWLSIDENIPVNIEEELIFLQKILHKNVDHWNEQELIYQFIAPFIHKVDYTSNSYKLFSNRKISGEVDGQLVSGEVDMILSSGKPEPKAPYFCLYKYVEEKRGDSDPLGQLIVSMMTAQAVNNNVNVIYGAYVTGRYWHFLTLKDKEYCISDAYVATQDDIFTIFKILKKLKGIIEEMATQTV